MKRIAKAVFVAIAVFVSGVLGVGCATSSGSKDLVNKVQNPKIEKERTKKEAEIKEDEKEKNKGEKENKNPQKDENKDAREALKSVLEDQIDIVKQDKILRKEDKKEYETNKIIQGALESNLDLKEKRKEPFSSEVVSESRPKIEEDSSNSKDSKNKSKKTPNQGGEKEKTKESTTNEESTSKGRADKGNSSYKKDQAESSSLRNKESQSNSSSGNNNNEASHDQPRITTNKKEKPTRSYKSKNPEIELRRLVNTIQNVVGKLKPATSSFVGSYAFGKFLFEGKKKTAQRAPPKNPLDKAREDEKGSKTTGGSGLLFWVWLVGFPVSILLLVLFLLRLNKEEAEWLSEDFQEVDITEEKEEEWNEMKETAVEEQQYQESRAGLLLKGGTGVLMSNSHGSKIEVEPETTRIKTRLLLPP